MQQPNTSSQQQNDISQNFNYSRLSARQLMQNNDMSSSSVNSSALLGNNQSNFLKPNELMDESNSSFVQQYSH
jgi:hypothetical protein